MENSQRLGPEMGHFSNMSYSASCFPNWACYCGHMQKSLTVVKSSPSIGKRSIQEKKIQVIYKGH